MPNRYKNKHDGQHAIILGSGPSTGKIINTGFLKQFDVIIATNHALFEFYDYLDYVVICEDYAKNIIDRINQREWHHKTPFIVSEVSIDKWSPKVNTVPCRREYHAAPDVRDYGKGFMARYKQKPTSSVALQALHFAGILGCSQISLIGCELSWRPKEDPTSHFCGNMNGYVDRRDNKRIKWEHRGCDFIMDKGDRETTDHFYKSALSIDAAIVELFRPAGIEVYDYSGGIITKAINRKLK